MGILPRLSGDYPDSLRILSADRSIIREAYPAYPPQVCLASSRSFATDSIYRSVDCRHISAIVRSGCDSRHIGAIGWLMYCMHINTIIVCVDSSTVLVIGSFGWQYNASNGVIFCR